MWPYPQFPADLVTFTEEIFNGKLEYLCSVLEMLTSYHHGQVLRPFHEVCCSMFRYGKTLKLWNSGKGMKFLTNFLHTKLSWGSKDSLLSTVTTSNFTIFSLSISLPLTLTFSLLSVVNIIWDLPLLALR